MPPSVTLRIWLCSGQAKLTIIVNNKIDENQMGEYERPAIQRWIKRVKEVTAKNKINFYSSLYN